MTAFALTEADAGSDAAAIRTTAVCEGDEYINYIRHADWEDSRTRRNPAEEESYTFFLYEQILAFKKAAEICNLTRGDIEDIFYHNAQRLLPQRE